MKKQTSNRTRKTYLLLALALMVLVVANTVAADTSCLAWPQKDTTPASPALESTLIEKMVNEIDDLPWRPLISFFK